MDDGGFSFIGFLFGGVLWFGVRMLMGLYTVNPNERAVKLSFGRAERLPGSTLDTALGQMLRADERERYRYPMLKVIPPGGPYFRWPWESVRKVSVATETWDLPRDPEDPNANRGGRELEAVTKDQLNIGLVGQLRFRLSERNLYAAMFGVKYPLVHVLAFFISILRQRIASFEAPKGTQSLLPSGTAAASELSVAAGVSINDLRKNLRLLNEEMDRDCDSSEARYGIILDASLITSIDPPAEVESALAAINTAHNSVGAEVSLAQASADQKIVQSRRAVEIETLNAQAEVEPLLQMSNQLGELKKTGGPGVLRAYVRNVKLSLFNRARAAFMEIKP